MRRSFGWLHAGLFLVTLATLLLENLDSRLLSVLTWYHLSFFAVSLAMLGMAAGAVMVFLRREAFWGERARRKLPRYAIGLAISIPVCHLANLRIPIPPVQTLSAQNLFLHAAAAVALAIPFFLSGVAVTIVLTRLGGAIGRLYASDLLGASAGCLLIVPLLEYADVTSSALVTGAIAAGAAACFGRFTGVRWGAPSAALALACLAAAGFHASSGGMGLTIRAKGIPLRREDLQFSAWNAHSFVVGVPASVKRAFYWGAGEGAGRFRRNSMLMYIDGVAGTSITEWDGDPEGLDWVKYGITYLPYHLRTGDVAIIGVGGGRDILSAIASGASSVTAVEVNRIFLDILQGSHREFAGIADRSEVTLVHDEGRAYLTRTDRRFDVLQMSLVDTWAATGAGAFTLSESGLYTREAWRTFLTRLKPDGILSVSRWFQPHRPSEASRLLALGVSALIERGVSEPDRNLILVSCDKVVNLMVATIPFSRSDIRLLRTTSDLYGFDVLAVPGAAPADPLLRGILASRSLEGLERAVANPHFDYRPPTDERPYFFNMLKPGGVAHFSDQRPGGVVAGNLLASRTLVTLLFVASGLVAIIIVLPLFWSGLPALRRRDFVAALAYFAIIGFMLVQIALLQRFTPFLGHPTYALAVVLFSSIFFAGAGSLLSDQLEIAPGSALFWLPAASAAAIAGSVVVIPAIVGSGAHLGLPLRCALAVLVTAPLTTPLGFCFPAGVRLVGRLSEDAAAWMWGVNGACSVLGSIIAVAISMWLGIRMNLVLAALLYALLTVPMLGLARAALPYGERSS